MSGKWMARIIWSLTRAEVLRFSEVRRACLQISDRILSRELKEFEACGLLARTVYPVTPPAPNIGSRTWGGLYSW